MSRPSSSMSRPSMSRPAPTPQRTTNIYMAPSMGYGGGNGLGLYLGISVAETFLREQQRQAYLQQQLGPDQAAIQQLQGELQAQNAKVAALQAQGGASNTTPMNSEADIEALKLKLQLAEKEKEIEMLKQAAVAK